ncbi:hypothetical protein ACSAZL_09595 [Methanosarcina sp. T3]
MKDETVIKETSSFKTSLTFKSSLSENQKRRLDLSLPLLSSP